jgi:hypothetical protein
LKWKVRFFAKFTAQLQTRDGEINLLGLPALGCGHVWTIKFLHSFLFGISNDSDLRRGRHFPASLMAIVGISEWMF